MKAKTKALALFLCAVLLVVTTVFVTMAYLTSQTEVVKNTFTVGDVKITLDEKNVDDSTPDAERDTANAYKLIPGKTYDKDPIVHVQPNSEESYVRLLVTLTNVANAGKTLNKAADGTILLQDYVDWNSEKWLYVGCTTDSDADTATYEFRYYTTVSNDSDTAIDLEALFTKITMPGDLDNDAIKNLDGVEINVIAHAIQADGFENAADAWSNWEND